MKTLGKSPLRILQVEDSDLDAELILRELRQGGLDFISRRVQTEEDFKKALFEFQTNIVIADYRLPTFDGGRALLILREHSPEIPLLIVSGSVGEEKAIELMRDGATDFVFKNQISGRLVPAVQRAMREIADRRARRRTEELLEQTGKVAGIGGWELDVRTMTPQWTAQTRRLHEVSPDYEPTLQNALNFYPPESRCLIDNAVHQAISLGTPYDLEVPLLTATGRQIWVRVIGKADVSEGRTVRLFGTFQDITRQRLLGEQLREERLRLANVIECTHLGIWERNFQTGSSTINKNFATILGYTLEELSPYDIETWQSLVHPEDFPRILQEQERHLSGETPIYNADYRMRHKNGDWVWLRGRGSLLSRTPDGQPLMMYGTILDIREEKEREEQLREISLRAESASRAKGTFLATMSHEIRTPLNAILGMTEILAHKPSLSDQEEAIETIRCGGDTLLSLINNILDFSKIEAGQIDLEIEPINLKKCAESAMNITTVKAHKKGLKCDLLMNSSLPEMIMGDNLRLRQVLVNLLANAVKFTEKGRVSLIISPSQNGEQSKEIKFMVRDTGIGIAEEEQSKLFQSFSQVDNSISRRYGGSGLGLAISSRIIQQMGGTFGVTSHSGEGSDFYFQIPCIPAEKPREKQKQNDPNQPGKTLLGERCPMHILIAEDNKINQRVLLMMLKYMGYSATVANNGIEALRMIRQSHVDLVLMDVQMPEMSGLEAAEKICEEYPHDSRPRLIAVTANAMAEDEKICLGAGMDGYLAKPISKELLGAVLESAYAEIFRSKANRD